jgi:hypothetical protein
MTYFKSFYIPSILKVQRYLDSNFTKPIVFQINYNGWICNSENEVILSPYQAYKFIGISEKENYLLVELENIPNPYPQDMKDFDYFTWMKRQGAMMLLTNDTKEGYMYRYQILTNSFEKNYGKN